ncbi:MAG: type II secretion system protein [Alphaproteobacteria bacterium]|nr:type II secretion system protein [Alphaproteobacteria bacterium]
MKSHFSRFLHHILSHSGIKEVFTSSLSLSDLIGESRLNQVANLSHLDYRVKPDNDRKGKDVSLKPDNDSLCTGRSMVEMLGVLAIIGVLSVGAIAGYSKAMFKYKLNKQAESFNILLNNALQLTEDLTKTVKSVDIDTDFFAKANLLPDSMYYKATENRIYDIFNNKIALYYIKNGYAKVYEYVLLIDMERAGAKISDRSREICRNIALAAKENAANLHSFRMRSSTESSYTENALYGGLSTVNYDLLQNATIKQIDDMCASCDSEVGCQIVMYLNLIRYQ